MIYDTRSQSNDTTESQKKRKACLNTHFQYSHSKITGLRQNIYTSQYCVGEHEEVF